MKMFFGFVLAVVLTCGNTFGAEEQVGEVVKVFTKENPKPTVEVKLGDLVVFSVQGGTYPGRPLASNARSNAATACRGPSEPLARAARHVEPGRRTSTDPCPRIRDNRLECVASNPDYHGRFTYDLVDQLDMVERLKHEGAAVETAECLGRLHLSSNPLCRGSATLLLRELNEAATLALPILEQTASSDALDESIRNDASLAIEMILEMLCERQRKTMTQPTTKTPDESNGLMQKAEHE